MDGSICGELCSLPLGGRSIIYKEDSNVHSFAPILVEFWPLMVYFLFSIAFVAINLAQWAVATSRSTPPAGALTVGSGGTYSTISKAVAAAKSGSAIFIYAGTYTEQVYITIANLTVYGQTAELV